MVLFCGDVVNKNENTSGYERTGSEGKINLLSSSLAKENLTYFPEMPCMRYRVSRMSSDSFK